MQKLTATAVKQAKPSSTAIDDWSGSVRLDEELGWADKDTPSCAD